MRKDSLIVFATSIVLTLGIVGGAHYLYLQDQKMIPDEPAVKPNAVTGTARSKPITNQPARGRTAKIIKCTQPNGTVFWTNSKRCEDVVLNNTFSYYDHAPRAKVDNRRKSNSKQTSRQTKNFLKPIPRSMTNACSFPIGMARRIEKKSLKLKKDPSDSIWKDSYCRWVVEARREGCGSINEYLELGRLCR